MKYLLCYCILLLFLNCERNFDISYGAKIPLEIIADRYGNHDDVISQDEIEFVHTWFEQNAEAWSICNHFNKYGDTVPADAISEELNIINGPYPDFTSLKNAFEGVGIRTPVVGICKIIYNHGYYVTELYSCPGPSVYAGPWRQKVIIN